MENSIQNAATIPGESGAQENRNECSGTDSTSVKQELLGLRDLITATDQKLIKLLGERQRLILRVGELKRQNNLPVRDMAREEALLKSLVAQGHEENISSELVVKIYGLIFDASRADQGALFPSSASVKE